MSRIKVLAASPRRALAALATVLVAVGVTGASGANFNASSANPSNTFTAGTLSMLNSKDGAAILTASNMRPGAPATTGTVDIENTGSLSAPFVLSKGTVSNDDAAHPMANKLNLKVVDCGDFSGGGKWERGQHMPTAPQLRAVARAFGVSMDAIDFEGPVEAKSAA